jgi:hypothetical protein
MGRCSRVVTTQSDLLSLLVTQVKLLNEETLYTIRLFSRSDVVENAQYLYLNIDLNFHYQTDC